MVGVIMKPNELVDVLRRMATAIDSSKNPDRNMVIEDLQKVLSTMSGQVEPINPVTVSFDGSKVMQGDHSVFERAVGEMIKRQPSLKTSSLRFTLKAELVK